MGLILTAWGEGSEMAKSFSRLSSSIGLEQSLQSKLLDSLVRLWHGICSRQGDVHPLGSNGLHIHDADET
jgi:hypothetical protein